MDHSYEEIRQAVIDILANRIESIGTPQYEHLKNAVAQVLRAQDGNSSEPYAVGLGYGRAPMSSNDADLLVEVFWGLFREGIITLGVNDSAREFPWFRLTGFGKSLVSNQDPYFFHDVTTYESLIRSQVPDIDDVTMMYLKEAMQDFRTGCLLSSSVMLGVAAEHTFMKLLETIEGNKAHYPTFKNVYRERTILRKLNKFWNILDQDLSILPPPAREDLDTNFMGITSVIRNFRNESGHPSGKVIGREQCFVNLQLFVPYCKKMYQLITVFT